MVRDGYAPVTFLNHPALIIMYFSLILYVPLVCLVCDDLARVISLLGLILCGEICSTISAHLGICVVESALVIWSEFDLWAFRR